MTSLSTMLQMGEKLKNQRCQAEGCTRNRAGMSPLCNGHQLKRLRYGHTHGRSILRHTYKQELNEVREFFREHPDHPAILAASMFFQRWMEEAGRQEVEVGQSILVRLHGHAIPALDILAEVSALWVYAHRNPHALPDDQRLTFALTRCAIRLAGFERKAYGETKRRTMKHPRMADLKATGERIRQTLARYFVNLTFAIEAQADEAKAIKTNLATPFI